MGLRDIESKLPPGFRFYPSDEELVCHYLQNKVANERVTGGTMVDVDLHTREPWELPEVAKLSPKEWYFFSFRDRKYATGLRTNRATKSGYWKATGKDRSVHDPITRGVVGMRKTLVFYGGRAPNGIKTNWVMHEFRLESPNAPPKEDWVLCRVFNKNKGDAMSCSMEDNEQENSIKHNDSNNSYYNFGSSSSSYLESSPPPIDLDYGQQHQLAMPAADHGCYELQQMASAAAIPTTVPQQEGNSILNLAVLHYNFLDHQVDNTDELMLDVAFNGHDLVGGGMTNLGGVRFHGVKDQFF